MEAKVHHAPQNLLGISEALVEARKGSWEAGYVARKVYITTKCYCPATAAAKSLKSCPTLCDPIDGSPRGSPVPEILQARTLEWVAFSNAWKWKVKVKVKSCPTLSDPMDYSLPGSSIHGIFQARVLEWGAIAFSKLYTLGWPKSLFGFSYALMEKPKGTFWKTQ